MPPGTPLPATTFQAIVSPGDVAEPPVRPVESTVPMVTATTSPPCTVVDMSVELSVPAAAPFTVQA